jgi:sulfatase modifying factor 1
VNRVCWTVIAAAILISGNAVHADLFGSGPNSFQIEFVTIGSAGNAPDATGDPNPAGAVPYEYRMGKYEISEQMMDKANALGGLGITKDNRGPDKPATSISWYEAAQFVNWLNTSTGHPAAYKFSSANNFQLWTPPDVGHDSRNLYRNRLAYYFLPSEDEWYKAAYFDPNNSLYFDYPTGSNVEPDGIDFAGDPTFHAVFTENLPVEGPNDITDVGLLSPFGTGGQGGNAYEWGETDYDLVNDSSPIRGLRGGAWNVFYGGLLSTSRTYDPAGIGESNVGFRVASATPEPNAIALMTIASALLPLIRPRAALLRI